MHNDNPKYALWSTMIPVNIMDDGNDKEACIMINNNMHVSVPRKLHGGIYNMICIGYNLFYNTMILYLSLM